MKPKVYIILVNYKGWKDTIECLESVYRSDHKAYQVIVVDNDSGDDSVEQLVAWARGESEIQEMNYELMDAESPQPVAKPFPFVLHDHLGNTPDQGTRDESEHDPLIIISSNENGGFAGGNNIGINYAIEQGDAEYVWLLNNDTIIKKDTLSQLVEGIAGKPDVAAVGSKLLYYDEPELLQSVGSVVDKASLFGLCKPVINTAKKNVDNDQYNQSFEVNDIMGASLMVRMDVIAKLGLIPEEYFLYGEETDWNFGFQTKGYRLMTIPTSTVYHKESRSTGGVKGAILLYYKTRNQFILYRKYRNVFIRNFNLYFLIYFIRKIFYSLTINAKSRKAIFAGLRDGIDGKTHKYPYVD